tara:strand:- start:24 stop:458 length:435 start_codon:yes stop_codon:yes gene_type:complete
MKNMLVFHSGAVDSSSVVEHNSGTDVDLVAFPVDAVAGIAAIEDNVKIYFNDGNRFDNHAGAGVTVGTNEVLEKCEVELTVAEGKEFDVVKALAELFSGLTMKGGYALFDAVNSVYPAQIGLTTNITGISIKRVTDTHTIASDA